MFSSLVSYDLRFHDYRSNNIPQLTVVVCSYQQESFIKESLNRVRQLHSIFQIELIFIDDGSSDNSFKLALSWQMEMNVPGLMIIKSNEGLVSSLNLALSLTRTPFIFFISADDLLCPEGIEILTQRLILNPSLKFAMGNSICFGDGIKPRKVYDGFHERYLHSSPERRSGFLPSELPGTLLIQTVIFRTEFLRYLGGWNSKIRLDDLPLFVRIFSMKPEYKKDYLYEHEVYISEYRQHQGNIHKKLIHQFQIYEEFIKKDIEYQYQSYQISYALGMYIIHALLKLNRPALKFFAEYARRQEILWLTLRQFIILIKHKTYRSLARSFES